MSGIGPVEPVNTAETDDSYDIIGADAPRLADRLTARWHTLPARTRRTALATAVITLSTIAILLAPTAGSPDHADPYTPMPWPANVTEWRYLGTAAPLNSHATSGLFDFEVSVDNGPPVTLTVADAAFAGLTAHATPEPDFTVLAGTSRRITVEISVSDCSGLPLKADLPFLDVTLRNTRAIQHHSFIFDGAYSRDLSKLLHRACRTRTPAQHPRPTGSARSQNAD
ncbi:hypothetical protein GCM10022403_026940 [Streptomyces coacervatus]|uniref:Tat pathway signal sequence domain protein n=1 Tax=Streptomyces coacervatus TaxID=647381 RepID=A0ABP7HFE3_9ACTN|nr:hypothetical protein [Streptomyces coacervatus]MDF2265565.1 hypothetical protein [Streptomyces coacervatus]